VRSLFIGNISHDTVMVKAITRIALYNEQDLARDLGARGLNAETGTLYQAYDQDDSESAIGYDLELWPVGTAPDENELRIAINRWMEGDTAGPLFNGRPWPDGQIVFDTDPSRVIEVDEPASRLYLIQPYSGRLQEVLR